MMKKKLNKKKYSEQLCCVCIFVLRKDITIIAGDKITNKKITHNVKLYLVVIKCEPMLDNRNMNAFVYVYDVSCARNRSRQQ